MTSAVARAEGRARILVVDDDPDMRELVAFVLTDDGLDVRTAPDGFAALNMIDDVRPDLIVSDVNMPGLSGFELVIRLRSDARTAETPVLFLSGATSDEDIVYGLSLGADDYITKPFNPPELALRVRRRLQTRPDPAALLTTQGRPVITYDAFVAAANREITRAERSGRSGCVAVLEVVERPRLIERLGGRGFAAVVDEVAAMARDAVGDLGDIGFDTSGRLLLLMPERESDEARHTLTRLARVIARRSFVAEGERVHITPAIGLAEFESGTAAPDLVRRARLASTIAVESMDLRPVEWDPSMVEPTTPRRIIPTAWRTYLQFAATLILGIVVPFAVYATAGALGFDLARVAYVVVVLALLVTGLLIWLEGIYALHPTPMPSTPSRPFPPASAVIAAYLPNEADTILETLEAFLRLDYPADLQVILAYNTPRPLPVEEVLHEWAARYPRLHILKVEGSTSKAQNVNAAVAMARGEFIGVFDADHQPARDAFVRAWHWLCDEYDVVQGHCVVRNGRASWVARTVAVEFEAIYAVSHPGRARLHGFGIFGGSNGYWRAERLRETRMQGSMLTEDIDSSLRVMAAGGRIASDPNLYSRELAPTTVVALWNQRMRWAQGWFQVSLRHLVVGVMSRRLTLRQRWGLWMLLGWREFYPWIAIQMVPIVAYLAWDAGGVNRLDWVVPFFVMTTLFTLSVGPGQTLFAWRLAAPEIKAQRSWFWWYLLVSTAVYTEFKNTINRISQVKEASRERQWKVTPRSAPGAGPANSA